MIGFLLPSSFSIPKRAGFLILRSPYSSVFSVLGNGGVMLCYILGFWLDWAYLALAGSMLPLPFLILVCLIPETPRYLISQDKGAEARSALQWLRGEDTDISIELGKVF